MAMSFSEFGDGREERLSALSLAMRLSRSQAVTDRRIAYEAALSAARDDALKMGNPAVIERLISNNPAYIRELLETEDARFGSGSVRERYARTFWSEYRDAKQAA